MNSAHRVENGIDARICEGVDSFDEVLSSVIDRRSSQACHEFVFPAGRSSIHIQSGHCTQLEKSSADTSCRTMDQNAITGLHAGSAMEHLICGNVVHDEA